MECYSAKKESGSDPFYNMDVPCKRYVKLKSQTKKDHILQDFLYRTCLEQANPQREKVGQCLPGVGRRGNGRVTAPRRGVSFGGDENVKKIIHRVMLYNSECTIITELCTLKE